MVWKGNLLENVWLRRKRLPDTENLAANEKNIRKKLKYFFNQKNVITMTHFQHFEIMTQNYSRRKRSTEHIRNRICLKWWNKIKVITIIISFKNPNWINTFWWLTHVNFFFLVKISFFFLLTNHEIFIFSEIYH